MREGRPILHAGSLRNADAIGGKVALLRGGAPGGVLVNERIHPLFLRDLSFLQIRVLEMHVVKDAIGIPRSSVELARLEQKAIASCEMDGNSVLLQKDISLGNEIENIVLRNAANVAPWLCRGVLPPAEGPGLSSNWIIVDARNTVVSTTRLMTLGFRKGISFWNQK